MFYHTYILAKKGQLANVWLAAHWDKKLTKAQIKETDIKQSVDFILKSQIKTPQTKENIPFALRLSAKLLLGIVRIYSRQVKFLLEDCSDALVKIKMSIRPTVVDLRKEQRVATYRAITLHNEENNRNQKQMDLSIPQIPEDFMIDNFDIPVEEGLPEDVFKNIERVENITRQQDSQQTVLEQAKHEQDQMEQEMFWQNAGDDDMDLSDVNRDESMGDNIGLDLGIQEDNDEIIASSSDDKKEIANVLEDPMGKILDTSIRQPEDPLTDPTISSTTTSEIEKEKPKAVKRAPIRIDESTMLKKINMQKHFNDTAPLLKESKRYRKKVKINLENFSAVQFSLPNQEGLAPELQRLFTRNFDIKIPPDSTTTTTSSEIPQTKGEGSPKKKSPQESEEIHLPVLGNISEEPEPEHPDVGYQEDDNNNLFDDTPNQTQNFDDTNIPDISFEDHDTSLKDPFNKSGSIETKQVINSLLYLRDTFETKNTEQISFFEEVKDTQKRVNSSFFYSLLVLKSQDVIDVEQEAPFTDIFIKKGTSFSEICEKYQTHGRRGKKIVFIYYLFVKYGIGFCK
eukprot:TRINITY_DN3006_c0_g1_i1.p1 TRINITY_DN3006_c0_g1~~TRINITY_DN3006_c0_g1_i1.p1  ORF type:complete len:569 (-),score=172.92 TRINITY_DN3006_c0_g1_i1:4-1710(-)